MNNEDGKIWYGLGIDNTGLQRDAEKSKAIFRGIGTQAASDCAKMDSGFNALSNTIKRTLTTAAIMEFGRQLVNITGQFQTFQAVLTNTLGDASKAKSAMDMIKEFAATTPFQVDALTGSFVKLANQGFTPTYEQMTLLGDLASSTGKGFDQLTEAIIDAQTGAFERLKEFGILASKEGENVTFTFKEQQTQVDFTASSIRDYILSLGELEGVQGANAAIAATLTGQVSNLQDSITQMMNEIGQSSSGALSGAISSAAYLVEHYEEVGRILGVLITSYGTYKSVIIAYTAVQKAANVAGSVKAFVQLTSAIKSAKDAQLLLNMAVGANPYIKLASILMTVGGLIWAFAKNSKSAADEVTGLEKATSEATKSFNEQAGKIKALQTIINDSNAGYYARNKAISELKALGVEYNGVLSKEGEITGNNIEVIDEYLVALEKKIRLQAYESELSAAMKRKLDAEDEAETAETNLYNKQQGGNPYAGQMKNAYTAQLTELKGAVTTAREKIATEEAEISKLMDKIKESASDDGKTVTTVKTYAEQVEAVAQSITTLKTKLAGLKSGSISSDDYATDIASIQKELTEAETKCNLLLGIDTKYQKQIVDNKAKMVETLRKADLEVLANEEESYAEQRDAQTKAAFDKAKAEEAKNKELLEKYATYEQQRLSLIEKYEGEIADMYSNKAQTTLKGGFTQGNVDNVVAEMNKALTDLDISNLAQLKIALGDVNKMNTAALTKSLDVLRNALDEATDPEQIKMFRDQISAVEDAMQDDWSSGVTTDIESVIGAYKQQLYYQGKLNDAKKEGSKATEEEIAEYEAALEKSKEDTKKALVGYGVNTLISGLQQSADLMKEIADLSGDVELGEMAETLSGIAQNLNAAGQGFASTGHWIGAVIGGVQDLTNQIISGIAEAEARAVEFEQNRINFLNEYALQKLKVDKDSYETIFGDKFFGLAAEAGKQAADALEKYNEAVNKSSLSVDDLMNEAVSGKSWKKDFNLIISQLSAADRGFTDLQAMAIKTKDAEWWQLGKKDEYTLLGDLVPDMWGDDGAFNVEAAQAFLDTNTQISDAQRDQIQNAIDLNEAYEEAMATLNDQISSVFGDLSTSLADVIWDSVANGTDAWAGFKEVGSEVISSLGKQMLSEMLLSTYLDKFEDQMKDAFTLSDASESANAIADVVNNIISGMPDVVGQITDAAQAWQDGMSDNGYSVGDSKSDSDRTSSSSSGITASQESVDSVDGRLTVMQAHTYGINDNTAAIRSDLSAIREHLGLGSSEKSSVINIDGFESHMDRMRDIASQQLTELKGINTNTARLAAIEDHLGDISEVLSDTYTFGTKLR